MHGRCTVDYNKAHALSYEFVYVCRLLRQSRFPTSLKFSIRMPLLGRWHSIWILRIHHQAMSVRHGLKSHSVSHSDAARRPICLVWHMCLFVRLFVCLFVCLCVYWSVCLWVFEPLHRPTLVLPRLEGRRFTGVRVPCNALKTGHAIGKN